MKFNIPLEDNASDILSKALFGSGLSLEQCADQCGLSVEAIHAAINDPVKSSDTIKLARFLRLNPDRLMRVAHGGYHPPELEIDGLAGFNSNFDDMTVNAFLVWDPDSRIGAAFDTGGDCDDLLAYAEKNQIRIESIFITHAHGDHIFDLDRMIEKTKMSARTPVGEPVPGIESFAPGQEFKIGSLCVGTRLTWGHCKGGVTYVIDGLVSQLAICGDAVFAGSMGGGKISYADALLSNKKEIFSLRDDTVLCPGHGPLTTVGFERANNPFFE